MIDGGNPFQFCQPNPKPCQTQNPNIDCSKPFQVLHKINQIQNMAKAQSQTKIEEKTMSLNPHPRINKIQHNHCVNPLHATTPKPKNDDRTTHQIHFPFD
jgi:hypothetical protein